MVRMKIIVNSYRTFNVCQDRVVTSIHESSKQPCEVAVLLFCYFNRWRNSSTESFRNSLTGYTACKGLNSDMISECVALESKP